MKVSFRLPCSALLLLGVLAPGSASAAQDTPPDRTDRPAPETETDARAEPDAWTYLARRYDADGNGRITRDEYTRGDTTFARLDHDGDGAITATDWEGREPSPEEQARRDALAARAVALLTLQADQERDVLTRGELEASVTAGDADGDGVLQREELEARLEAGAVRRAPPMVAMLVAGRDPAELLVGAVDTDGDGALALPEFLAWFDAQDPEATGRWTADDLRRALGGIAGPERGAGRGAGRGPGRGRGREPGGGAEGGRRGPRDDGPELATQGRTAPDFTLQREHGGETMTLSSFVDDRPVALIFGSFT
ncbi:MAG: EF-hand domain-containing protein [Planctomycetota bacterium]|jgi:hypothetical protein